jgi:ankyrin repeat protein
VVRLLLDRGADVNAEQNGFTTLHWAVEQGHDATAAILARAGAPRFGAAAADEPLDLVGV